MYNLIQIGFCKDDLHLGNFSSYKLLSKYSIKVIKKSKNKILLFVYSFFLFVCLFLAGIYDFQSFLGNCCGAQADMVLPVSKTDALKDGSCLSWDLWY